MTRGMFVTDFGRLAEADVSSYKTSKFTDVKADAYYLPYIEWANKNDIVKGTSDTTFAADQKITREQMAVMMVNYAKVIGVELPNVHTENIFADNVKISSYAKTAVKQMQMAGVISGKNGNLFDRRDGYQSSSKAFCGTCYHQRHSSVLEAKRQWQMALLQGRQGNNRQAEHRWCQLYF